MILKFDREIFQGLTPMVFLSVFSHAILLLMIIMISSRLPKTTLISEPIFTVSLSPASLPPAGGSDSMSAGKIDIREMEVPEETKPPEKIPVPLKKKQITLPEKASKKKPAQKKIPPDDHAVQKNGDSSLSQAEGSQKASGGIATGAMEGGSGGISAAGMDNFEYAWYRATIISKLKEHWIKPVLPFRTAEPLQVIVYFVIERDGSVSHMEIDATSGYPPLDRSAIRAIYDSVPFPPLPRQISQPNLPAKFIFELKQE